ncbi:transporter substrate-binding domain-containing protein [Rathayibacter sp. VKM Ac-2759]|uniref:substrate-binding periplasmic protein n=1 Tax=Rathayibacter sp. VKM Ac-2759 TaxID=2609252 RepID=UPI0013161320|nr:transporter substrate-binding domain-containing protein [Rathayibacter sp. VKM Ac-2759]QHC68046.1 transporter substrate-binding domain-containing protein [Rathayibacter sp. VKM Ac-2759]
MSIDTRFTTRVLGASAIALLSVSSLVACSADSGSSVAEDCTPAHEGLSTITAGELTIASYDYAPATIIDGDGLTGMEGDLVTEIAAMECLKLTVTSSGGAGAVIPSVQTQRADLGSGNWLRTTERAEIVYMSTPLWLNNEAVVSTSGLTSDDLEGKKVGSVAGNLYNESLAAWLGDDFTVYQDDEAIYSDLEAGRIDALVASETSAIGRFKSSPIEGATVIPVEPNEHVAEWSAVGQVMWPSSLENEAFGKAIDEDIEKLREDGTIAEILEKYDIDPSVGEPGEPTEL